MLHLGADDLAGLLLKGNFAICVGFCDKNLFFFGKSIQGIDSVVFLLILFVATSMLLGNNTGVKCHAQTIQAKFPDTMDSPFFFAKSRLHIPTW